MKFISSMLSVAACLLLAGCVRFENYEPPQASNMSYWKAKTQFAQTLSGAELLYQNGMAEHFLTIKEVAISSQGFELRGGDRWALGQTQEVKRYKFKDLHPVCYTSKRTVQLVFDSRQHGGRDLDADGHHAGSVLRWHDDQSGKLCFDALRVLTKGRAGADTEFEQFKVQARAWRALATKPDLTEDARRQKVLAENAYREKRFEEVIEFYQKGLTVTPLWPEAQFNTAMVASELGDFYDAVYHMRRYLELAPDAADAKMAREKMIVWEDKAFK